MMLTREKPEKSRNNRISKMQNIEEDNLSWVVGGAGSYNQGYYVEIYDASSRVFRARQVWFPESATVQEVKEYILQHYHGGAAISEDDLFIIKINGVPRGDGERLGQILETAASVNCVEYRLYLF